MTGLSACVDAGLVKPKTYDWKDSNLAMFGSDTEKQVKSTYKIALWMCMWPKVSVHAMTSPYIVLALHAISPWQEYRACHFNVKRSKVKLVRPLELRPEMRHYYERWIIVIFRCSDKRISYVFFLCGPPANDHVTYCTLSACLSVRLSVRTCKL